MDAARLEILQAIAAGQVSAQEGARLLDALEGRRAGGVSLRLRVVDLATQRPRLDVALPLAVLELCARLSLRLDALFGAGGEIDPAAVWAAAREGADGVVAEVIDEESRQRVQLMIERP